MISGQPSRTALGAALHRAAHQVLDGGFIFADPLALRILGRDAEAALAAAAKDPGRGRSLRLFIAVRTRFAEDAFAASEKGGVRQLVILGAGLDTYAYRSAMKAGVRIFEVDHPATQAWKRERLSDAAIAVPSELTFVPIDFERESLGDGLCAAGFDPSHQSFFTWLGVVPYLTERAAFATLGFIAALPGRAHVVFEYVNPPDSIADEASRAALEGLASRVAAAGEPLKSYFDTESLKVKLSAIGFREIDDLGSPEIAARYFPTFPSPTQAGSVHILRASTI
jgi:methyltransferase (TIGR00027 family)